MPLTVLSDGDVRALLHSLTRDDILDLQQSLADALHYYSNSTEDSSEGAGCCSTYQPQRTSLKRADGNTTLFMPASSNAGLGVKIVTLSTPEASKGGEGEAAPSRSSSSSTVGLGVEDSGSASQTSVSTTTPRGALTLLDAAGCPRALVNAEELTAFRTALASTLLFAKRRDVHDITVFGAGKQAYWHIRLALLLRGEGVHHVNVVNRSFERARVMVGELFRAPEGDEDEDQDQDQDQDQFEGDGSAGASASARHGGVGAGAGAGLGGGPVLHRPKIALLTPLHTEYARHLKHHVRSASALFLCTPSLAPLFPHALLTSTEGRRKGRYIAAVGSYKPHMLELPPEVLRQAVQPDHGRHFHRHARQGGAVVVDSVEACLREAGEVVQAGLGGEELVELGELVMLRRDAERRKSLGGGGGEGVEVEDSRGEKGGRRGSVAGGLRRRGSRSRSRSRSVSVSGHGSGGKGDGEGDGGLKEWLEKGNVVYKSVGLGLMDVVVGMDLVNMADARGVGTRIMDF